MAEKKITRKVITTRPVDEGKKAKPPVKEEIEVVVPEVVEESSREAGSRERVKKGCSFCAAKTTPSYLDMNALKRYLTDRAKISPRGRSGVCARHQRAVAKNIKYARHLALLPFVPHL